MRGEDRDTSTGDRMLLSAVCRFPCGCTLYSFSYGCRPRGDSRNLKAPLRPPLPPDPELQAEFPGSPADKWKPGHLGTIGRPNWSAAFHGGGSCSTPVTLILYMDETRAAPTSAAGQAVKCCELKKNHVTTPCLTFFCEIGLVTPQPTGVVMEMRNPFFDLVHNSLIMEGALC